MEIVYNVKNKFKTKDNITKDEFRKIFNLKLLNIIMILENENLLETKSWGCYLVTCIFYQKSNFQIVLEEWLW